MVIFGTHLKPDLCFLVSVAARFSHLRNLRLDLGLHAFKSQRQVKRLISAADPRSYRSLSFTFFSLGVAYAHANCYIPTVAGPKDRENFDVWLADIKQQRQQLLAKRLARRQRKKDLAQRRTAAAQERMRLISQLARKDKKDDNFGSRDEDWDVYKAINKVN